MSTVLDQPIALAKPVRVQCRACLHWVREPLSDDCCSFCVMFMNECRVCFRLTADDESACEFCGESFDREGN